MWHDSNFFALIPYDSKRDTILHLLWLVIDHILTTLRELFLQNCFILASYPIFVNQPLTTTIHITVSSPLSFTPLPYYFIRATSSEKRICENWWHGMCDTLVAYIIVLSYRLRFFAWRRLRPTNHHQAPPPPAAARTTATAIRMIIVQLGPSSCLRTVGCWRFLLGCGFFLSFFSSFFLSLSSFFFSSGLGAGFGAGAGAGAG